MVDNPTGLATVKNELLNRRAALIARVEAMTGSLTSEHDHDLGDQAIERESDDVLERLSQTDRHEAEMIDAAIARIENGTYGFCTSCGESIAAARLDAVPETPFCHACAQKV